MPATQINIDAATADFAIVVGINDYPVLGEDRKPANLRGPVQDAYDVTRFLVDEVGVPCANVICLTSAGAGNCMTRTGTFDEVYHLPKPRPTDNDMKAAIQTFIERASAKVGEPQKLGRRLWMYFAGHGVVPSVSPSDVALLSADAQKTMILNHFTATAWADMLALLPPFDEIILWMDCCTSLIYAFSPVRPPAITLALRKKPAEKFYVMAVGPDQKAFEFQDSQGRTRGIFTKRLIDALQSDAVLDRDGWVTAEALRNFMINDTHGRLSEPLVPGSVTTQPQKPSFPHVANLKLFHRAPFEKKIRIPTAFAPGEKVDLKDAFSALVSQLHAAADGSVEVALGTGFFRLIGAGGKTYFFETPGRLFGEVRGQA